MLHNGSATRRTVMAAGWCLLNLTLFASMGAQTPAQNTDRRAIEIAKFDNPKPWMAKATPGGTAWDNQYRSLIQTSISAEGKGFPGHIKASEQILADAKRSSANLLQHKGWVLFIRNASEAYRPAEATAALRTLFEKLVDLEIGGNNAESLSSATAIASSLAFDGDARVSIHRDVVYGRTDFAAQRLDAYLVHSTRPAPVLVEFHGGGWRNGNKSEFTAYPGDLISKVIDAGVSVISVEYRKTPAYALPAMTDDAVRAIQFIRSKAAEWHIDPDRIVAIGGSAGAHLATWVALHDNLADPKSPDLVARQSSRLKGFIDLWGPMDLTRADPGAMSTVNLRGEDFAKAYLQGCNCTAAEYITEGPARQRMRDASPLFLVTRDDPPGLIVHQGPVVTGMSHPEIPAIINDPHSWQHGALLADAMDRAGLIAIRYISPTAGKDPGNDIPKILDFLKLRFRL